MSMQSHLISRYLHPNELAYIDEVEQTATFTLYNTDHTLVGYQQYRPNGSKKERRNPKAGKYFTYLNSPGYWGGFNLPTECTLPNTLVICEGIFKACRFRSHGVEAIATLTNNPLFLLPYLKLISLTTNIIVVSDPDQAGTKLHKFGDSVLTPTKPVDEMSEHEFSSFLTLLQG